MSVVLEDVKNENLLHKRIYVVASNITHVKANAFNDCSNLHWVVFSKPVEFVKEIDGYSQINGIFRRNYNLECITFPKNQDEICFNILLNCPSDKLEIYLSEKAHDKLVKDIDEYNAVARQPFTTKISFGVYEKSGGIRKETYNYNTNVSYENQNASSTSKTDADAGEGNEIKK